MWSGEAGSNESITSTCRAGRRRRRNSLVQSARTKRAFRSKAVRLFQNHWSNPSKLHQPLLPQTSATPPRRTASAKRTPQLVSPSPHPKRRATYRRRSAPANPQRSARNNPANFRHWLRHSRRKKLAKRKDPRIG
uniref:(northern house mosquito) hypothetical protein n=1 Tax=Culex pipiens TaxID=7175 RepID=A0A8D8EZM2_CULPI